MSSNCACYLCWNNLFLPLPKSFSQQNFVHFENGSVIWLTEQMWYVEMGYMACDVICCDCVCPRNSQKLEPKDVLPNINRIQLSSHFTHAVCALTSSPPPGSNGMVLSATEWRYLQRAHYNAFSVWRKFVPGDLDLWPWHSNSSEWGTRYRYTSSLWIWRKSIQQFSRYLIHKQKTHKNKKVTDIAKNRTLCSSLRVVITLLIVHW